MVTRMSVDVVDAVRRGAVVSVGGDGTALDPRGDEQPVRATAAHSGSARRRITTGVGPLIDSSSLQDDRVEIVAHLELGTGPVDRVELHRVAGPGLAKFTIVGLAGHEDALRPTG